MDAATVGAMAGAFGSLVLVGGSATVARQKLLNLLRAGSSFARPVEMPEFVRTLFLPVSFPCLGV